MEAKTKPGPRLKAGGTTVKRRNKRKNRKGAQHQAAGSQQPAQQPVQTYACRSGSDDDFSDSEDEGLEGYKKGGYHPVRLGEKYCNGRYTVLQKLGWGHFSTVWLVKDATTGKEGAMKVQKSARHYTEAARDEIKLLTDIRDRLPNQGDAAADTCNCVLLLNSFDHRGPHGLHVCMVFEVLGDNLLALIKEYNYRGIPPSLVRRIARQVLVALHYLHTTCAIIHTDLKPENIMLTQALRPRKRPPQPLEDGAALTPPPNGHADPAATSSAHTSTPSGLTKNQKKKWKRKQKKSAAKGPLQQVLDSHASGASPSHDSCSTSMDMNGEEDSAEVNHREAESAMSPERRGARQDAGALGEQEMSGLSDFRLDDEQAEPCLLDHPESIHCKVADFGNACWVHKQFTTDIQTRQYRCPEVILGANYSTPADMWSLACMIFELVTGDHLFDPRSGRDYGRCALSCSGT
ncbi:hypothetical protein WJX73_007151 [Symbiochloris irregularis]|uniref:non-specific serine/threonine protein kinase n=1 Tax=Symbiochloris irregularis TaxID=706552 RepID=A0AAW1NRQ6_9CHLO